MGTLGLPAGGYRNPNAFDRSDDKGDPFKRPSSTATRQATDTYAIDTAFFDLPLILEAGPVATMCYLAALLYTQRHGTNGYIPQGAVGSLVDWEPMGVTGREAAERCVSVGLFDRIGGGYLMRDYHSAPIRSP